MGDSCRCHNVRFEERAREFLLQARLTQKGSRSESNKFVAFMHGTAYLTCVESVG